MNAALGYLARNAAELNIEPDAIVLAGDSAGAQIASLVALITTDPSYARQMGISPSLKPERLAAILLLSGGFDIESVDLEGDFGWFLKTVLWAYSGTRDFMNDDRFRLISVTHYVTSAFPPAFISSGNGDPLTPQAMALARKLEALGVTVDSLFFPADYTPPLPHEYQFNLDIPAGQEALERTLAFIGVIVQPKQDNYQPP
ncbi:alpha/beta hydrolase [Mesorhizobium sp. M1374]|uniref:alpha/beta hydrolase n=1 Tax=Mesorhizobium sp. M1374 TaxID=2957091 RepID=UPI00333A4C2F